jgi:hypothetical protein
MKNAMVCGSLVLALCALSALLGRPKRMAVGARAVPQPIPPCTYQYKEFLLSLN